MEIIIHQAILHVLDTTLDAPVLSGGGMELTAEKTAYLQNHIEKLLASDEIRQCRPLPDSAFRNELEHNQDFIDLSCRIAGVLFDYMHAHTTIPGADLAVVDFTRDGAPWLGILKLNYKNGYTHYTETVEGAFCTTCLRPAAESAPPADPSTFSFFRILQQCKTPAPGSEAGTGVLHLFCYRMHRLMARATASSSSCPMKPNFASCSSAKQTVSSEVCSGSPKPAVLMP